jgi:hypothetical protein
VNSQHHDDPLIQSLAALPAVHPDPLRAKQLRDRCHAALESPAEGPIGPFEPATVGAVCAMYAWEIVRVVIR